MTYNSRKFLYGQEFVEEVELILDACKYSQGAFWNTRRVVANQVASNTYFGNLAITGAVPGWHTTWLTATGTLFLNNKGETIEVEIDPDDDSSIILLTREMKGFPAEIIYPGDELFLMHQGEADGSCRGFPHTCSSPDSYSESAKVSLFFATSPQAGGTHRFPGLYHGSCEHDAGEVDVGESIGQRGRLRVKLQDQQHNDEYIVPYPERRSSAGTMFGKLLARHPYLSGREIIYREGYRDSGSLSAPDWIERRFIVDDASLSKDTLTISALDPLIFTEDKKAKIPVASPAVLSADIDTGNTPFSFADAPNYYFGGNGSFCYVRIEAEVMYCQVSGATTLTPVTRGYRSEIKAHEAGASIQDCVAFQGTNGIDAIVFALQNYTDIPSKFIGNYASVKALLPTFILEDAIISKPMAVVEFINHLIKIGNLIMHYHEVNQKIVINYIPELSIEPIVIDERQHIERDSVSMDDNIKNQWTRFQHLWAPTDITKDSEENFAIRYLAVNIDLESKENLGYTNEKKEYKNILLSNSPNDSLQGISYANRVIEQTGMPPKIANFKINAAYVGDVGSANIGLGSIINLSTKENQDKDGNAIAELFQILKLTGNGYDDYRVKARRYQAIEPDDIDFVISNSAEQFNLASVFAPAAGHYTIYINPDVVIGSVNAAIPAFTTGSQAPGVSFTIINRGKILGMGGAGGNVQLATTPPGSGMDGGNAFNATVDVIIENGSGLIWAGGGGASGGNIQGYTMNFYTGGPGGGGGQGYGISASGRYTNGASGGVMPQFDGMGTPGSQSSPGTLGGGEWGMPGNDNNNTPSSTPGLGGYAIVSNGNTVTITTGNNEFNIRGRRT